MAGPGTTTCPSRVKAATAQGQADRRRWTGPDYDQWDGYPVERAEVLIASGVGRRNVVVLSGDVHVGMVDELARRRRREAGRGRVRQASLTSQNLDDKMGWEPLTESVPLADAYVAGMDHIHWVDFDSHGYNLIDVTPDRVVAEWWAVDTVLRRTSEERCVATWSVANGVPRVVRGDGR